MTRHVLILTRPFIPQRLTGINRLASRLGWIIQTASVENPPTDWNGDGALVILGRDAATADYVAGLVKRGIPVVDLVEDCPEIRIPRVTGDDLEIGRLAAEHFNARNFRHAAYFSLWNGYCHATRLKGFKKAWRGAKPAVWLWPEEAGDAHTDLKQMLAWLAEKLRTAPKPLAVFAWNDTDATLVLNACREAKLSVPHDAAILGVDNKPICEQQRVKLSSIAHNLQRIGYTGAAMLERLMSGRKLRRRLVRIKPQGVVTRDSTGAIHGRELRPIIAYIDDHLSRPLGATEIAADLRIPRKRLNRLFTEELGHSVRTEITNRRIAKAKKLLKRHGASVEDVARECGYCNTSFFIRCFRQATGTTPLAWRKRH